MNRAACQPAVIPLNPRCQPRRRRDQVPGKSLALSRRRVGLDGRLLGDEQEDVGLLLVGGVGVQDQPARGKTEAFARGQGPLR